MASLELVISKDLNTNLIRIKLFLMGRVLCIWMESAPQHYKCSSLVSDLVKTVQTHLQTLQSLFSLGALLSLACMKNWSLPLSCWLSAFSKVTASLCSQYHLFL